MEAKQMNIVFDDYAALENCENLEESYGEICLHCDKCGRFNKESEGERLDERLS